MAKMKKVKKFTILKGEGSNQHTLYGDIMVDATFKDFSNIVVNKDGLLKHETPSGNFAEHQTLAIEKGTWVMGKQVEYNPFKRQISNIWD